MKVIEDYEDSFFDEELLNECTDGRLDYCKFSELRLGTLFFFRDNHVNERYIKVSRHHAINLDYMCDVEFNSNDLCMLWGRAVYLKNEEA